MIAMPRKSQATRPAYASNIHDFTCLHFDESVELIVIVGRIFKKHIYSVLDSVELATSTRPEYLRFSQSYMM